MSEPVLVSLLEPPHELAGVFLVEEHVDPLQAALLLGVLPEALEPLSLGQVLQHPHLPPVLQAVLVLPQTLAAHALEALALAVGALGGVLGCLRYAG
jgi:hypothetical protein